MNAAGAWFLALALLPAVVRAGETLPVNLAQALELAERQSPDLEAIRQRALAQEARARASDRTTWPRLSFSLDASRSDNSSRVFAGRLDSAGFTQEDFALERLNDPGSLSHLTTAVSLALPLDAFGKAKRRARVDEAQSRAAAAQAREAAQQVRLQAAEAYYRAGLARAALDATRTALLGAQGREKDVEARVEQGASLTADLLRARARRRQREADLADREADLRIALSSLARVLGAPEGTRYEPLSGAAAPQALEGALENWQARALAARPYLAVHKERLAMAAHSREGERRTNLPDVTLYGSLQDDRAGASPGGQSYAAGVSVRWSVFDPARGKRIAAAVADERASTLELRAAVDQTRLDVETAWQRARSARERYKATAGGAEEGREALRVIQERRRAGMATLTDELETEAAGLAAEIEELRAAADAAVADAALRRATGGL
jgi:outer membrane protein TolC